MAEKENLSAFFDGESLEHQSIEDQSLDARCLDKLLMDKLGNDASLQDEWRSFALTRDLMRGDANQCASWNIADRVAIALENEPNHGLIQDEIVQVANVQAEHIHVANAPVSVPDENPNDKIVAMRHAQLTPKQAIKSLPSWFQQLTQVGMAAGVALAVIVGVQQYNQGDGSLSGPQPPVLQTIPLSGSAEPVSFSRKSRQSNPNEANPNEAKVMEQRRRINGLFQDYDLQLRLNGNEITTENAHLISNMDEWNQ